MKLFTLPPSHVNFIILVPIIAKTMGGSGDKPMSASELRTAFSGNTVVAELPEGTAYDYVESSGQHRGLHPTHGRLDGSWHIDADGEACVTWNYSSGAMTNCGTVVDAGDGKYRWGDQVLKVQRGNVKNLGGE